MKKLLILFSIAFSQYTFSCINEYRTLLTGETIYTNPTTGIVTPKEINESLLNESKEKLLEEYQTTKSIEAYSDYATVFVYLGQFQEAKRIFEEIEAIKPNLYTTASNLGTIYELIGQPDSALIWIKKSIELNPDSHRGSEWIHVKILEYQLGRNNNSSILGLDFGNDAKPNNLQSYDLSTLRIHIWHQLAERTTFVKPKNEIVGNLYFDLGNVLAQVNNLESAIESYEQAKLYGFESELIDLRLNEFREMTRFSSLQQATFPWIYENKILFLIIVAFVGLLFLTIVFLILRRLFQRKK